MCEHFGYEVTKLERVRIMNIDLKGLPLGDWRELTDKEMETIYAMIEDSTSEHLKNPKKAAVKKPVNANKDLRGTQNTVQKTRKTAGTQKSSYSSAPTRKPSKNAAPRKRSR